MPLKRTSRVEFLLRLTARDKIGASARNYPAETTERKLLEAHGWKVGDMQDFLELTEEELECIEIKIALGEKVREIRPRRKMTQKETAALIGSSQSRVAKMEAGDPSVSIDLQVKSLLALGVSREELGETIKAELMASA